MAGFRPFSSFGYTILKTDIADAKVLDLLKAQAASATTTFRKKCAKVKIAEKYQIITSLVSGNSL